MIPDFTPTVIQYDKPLTKEEFRALFRKAFDKMTPEQQEEIRNPKPIVVLGVRVEPDDEKST